MPALVGEIEARWNAMFVALAEGGDVPPGQRLRTEGMMEAAVLLELASAADLTQAMDRSYRAAFGRGIADGEAHRQRAGAHAPPRQPSPAT